MAVRGFRGFLRGYPFDGSRPQAPDRAAFADTIARNRIPAALVPFRPNKLSTMYGDIGPVQLFELPAAINQEDSIQTQRPAGARSQVASRRSA